MKPEIFSEEVRSDKDIIIAIIVEDEGIENIITAVKKANRISSLLKEKRLIIREGKEGYKLKNGYLF